MSLLQYFKVIDTPFAIVAGSVGAVLITLQLGAVGVLAQDQIDRAAERDASMKANRQELVSMCLGGQPHAGYAACAEQQQRRHVAARQAQDGGATTVAAR